MPTQLVAPFVPLQDPIANVRNGLVGHATWEEFFRDLTGGFRALQTSVAGNLATVLHNTHAARVASFPASDYDAGVQYFETDRGVFYRTDGTDWLYTSGEMRAVLGAEPTDLGADDAGFRLFVTDYRHRVYWTGSAWDWADGDVPGRLAHFAADPGVGWGVLDGTTYDLLTVGATLGTSSFVSPNPGGAYLKDGAYTGSVNAASGTTGTGNTGTGTTGTGTTGTGVTGTGTTSTADASFHVGVAAGADETVPDQFHTHTVPALDIPGLSIPGLSVPSLSVPGLGVGTLEMRHVAAPIYVRL